jgi:BirA family biotin operon repressor/biotin-[acetyl-CoA-carboxylase] ligase
MNREATDLAGVRHLAFETLGSTNAEALARARAGECGPLWISTGSQSAGRGRRGNLWVSLPGNLYATLLLSEPSAKSVAAQLSFVAVLALHDAVADCAPQLGPQIEVKWPNDLLLGGKKIAGILIEAESDPVFSVAVGFGANCVSHPRDATFPATDLKASGATVAPQTLLAALARRMTQRIAQWQRGQGFAAIRADWLKRAVGLGEPVRVRLPDKEMHGRFQGLDDAGRLLLEQSTGVITVTTGDVFGLSGA